MDNSVIDDEWVEQEEEGEEEYPEEFEITAAPNDFNVRTLFDFVNEGFVKIPGFQRNYVWDIKKASRLIESLIMGIPVPQLFLYEKGKDNFLVIDGQQRLMTLYYFLKGRIPRMEKRAELRRIIDQEGGLPEKLWSDRDYFSPFELKLAMRYADKENRLQGLTIESLDEQDKRTLFFRPIRCVFIKQVYPDNDSSMYEIFYRLNTGGENLTPQEIRSSLYYSEFYDMLTQINLIPMWRKLTSPNPDKRMRDIEILLRGFASVMKDSAYSAPMVRFLNRFSERAKLFPTKTVERSKSLFNAFLGACEDLPARAFQLQTGRFSASVYEAVFTAACEKAYKANSNVIRPIRADRLIELKEDNVFLEASSYQTTSVENVKTRLDRAREILYGE